MADWILGKGWVVEIGDVVKAEDLGQWVYVFNFGVTACIIPPPGYFIRGEIICASIFHPVGYCF